MFLAFSNDFKILGVQSSTSAVKAMEWWRPHCATNARWYCASFTVRRWRRVYLLLLCSVRRVRFFGTFGIFLALISYFIIKYLALICDDDENKFGQIMLHLCPFLIATQPESWVDLLFALDIRRYALCAGVMRGVMWSVMRDAMRGVMRGIGALYALWEEICGAFCGTLRNSMWGVMRNAMHGH
jgi:hypothetical protein